MKELKFLFVLVGLAVLLSGCSTAELSGRKGPVLEEFTLHEGEVLQPDNSLTPGPKELVHRAIAAWYSQAYEEAGDFLRLAYFSGSERGWIWQSETKVRLLSHALRAYHLAGAVKKQKDIAQAFLKEMNIYDRALLSRTDKVLLYWSTSDFESPAFENEIPPNLKITAFVR